MFPQIETQVAIMFAESNQHLQRRMVLLILKTSQPSRTNEMKKPIFLFFLILIFPRKFHLFPEIFIFPRNFNKCLHLKGLNLWMITNHLC